MFSKNDATSLYKDFHIFIDSANLDGTITKKQC